MSSLTITGDPKLGETLTCVIDYTGGDSSIELSWSLWDAPTGGSYVGAAFAWDAANPIVLGDDLSPLSQGQLVGRWLMVAGEFDVSGSAESARVGPITSSSTGPGFWKKRLRKTYRRYFDENGNRI